jgi:hypothetical protein
MENRLRKNLIEELQAHAQTYETGFFMNGRIMYADEVYSPNGFMPLIGRFAERAMQRTLGIEIGKGKQCGFAYLPYASALLYERLDVAPVDENTLDDSLRLAYLRYASEQVVGLGYQGTLDLSPVYEYFMSMRDDERNAMRDARHEEPVTWPLYQPIQVS